MSSNIDPFFSVVIPVYNKKPHIRRCIDSVLNQSFKEFEVIIVCDPSTDGSTDEVLKYTDPRIKVLKRDLPGPGGYAARNLGIKNASCEWICFLDADDEWDKNHLSEKLTYIYRFPNLDIFSGSWKIKNKDNELLDDFSKFNNKDIFLDLTEYVKNEALNRRAIFTSVLTIRKSIIEDNQFPDGKINMGGDVDTWIRCIFSSSGVYFINKTLTYYHTDSVSMVTKNSYIDPLLHIETTNRLLELTEKPKLKKYLNMRLNGLLVYAWKNNCTYSKKTNFPLYKKLNYKYIKLRWLIFLFISIFPKSTLNFLFGFSK